MQKRVMALCVLAAIATVLLAACGKSEDGKITTTAQPTTTQRATTEKTTNPSTTKGMLDEASEKLSQGITELESVSYTHLTLPTMAVV